MFVCSRCGKGGVLWQYYLVRRQSECAILSWFGRLHWVGLVGCCASCEDVDIMVTASANFVVGWFLLWFSSGQTTVRRSLEAIRRSAFVSLLYHDLFISCKRTFMWREQACARVAMAGTDSGSDTSAGTGDSVSPLQSS